MIQMLMEKSSIPVIQSVSNKHFVYCAKTWLFKYRYSNVLAWRRYILHAVYCIILTVVILQPESVQSSSWSPVIFSRLQTTWNTGTGQQSWAELGRAEQREAKPTIWRIR